jgi:hypothetical protein
MGRWYFFQNLTLHRWGCKLIKIAIDDGSLYYKPEALTQYRDETIAVIEQSLSWDPNPQEKPHPNPAIQSFWDLGVEFRRRGTPGMHSYFSFPISHYDVD